MFRPLPTYTYCIGVVLYGYLNFYYIIHSRVLCCVVLCCVVLCCAVLCCAVLCCVVLCCVVLCCAVLCCVVLCSVVLCCVVLCCVVLCCVVLCCVVLCCAVLCCVVFHVDYLGFLYYALILSTLTGIFQKNCAEKWPAIIRKCSDTLRSMYKFLHPGTTVTNITTVSHGTNRQGQKDGDKNETMDNKRHKERSESIALSK
jgi:hypothetical protein